MKRRYYLAVPPQGDNEFWSVSERDLKAQGLHLLADRIGHGCTTVERVRTPLYRAPYAWVDEDGLANRQAPNYQASHALYPGHLAGTVLVELGAFDLTEAEEYFRFLEAAGRWPATLRGEPFLPVPLLAGEELKFAPHQNPTEVRYGGSH